MSNSSTKIKNICKEDGIEARAILYKLISVGFRYPSESLINALTTEQYWIDLLEIANLLEPEDSQLKALVAGNMEELRLEAQREQLTGFEVEYNQLFQVAKQIECPLTASEYMKGEGRQALAVAQLSGLYTSFGVKMREFERHDNLSVLLEFMSWICAKELNALTKGEYDNVASCLAAEKILLDDYLGWLPLLMFAVESNANIRFYLWLTEILIEFLRMERASLLDDATQNSCVNDGE
ncbi:MAG: molecular chaperone TorD family protein [Candidatus Obscuribacterales bacterium]|nr:molecular chaperone TorD family protein [Candidatus Obscuribacterales bacterium]